NPSPQTVKLFCSELRTQLAATISLRSHRHSSPPRTDGGCGVAYGRLEALFGGSSNASRSNHHSCHRSSFRRRCRKVSWSPLLSSHRSRSSPLFELSLSFPVVPTPSPLTSLPLSLPVQKKLCLGLDEAAGVP
ncbi:hypothetical protein S83_029240, partial [Arachis hypogaea]